MQRKLIALITFIVAIVGGLVAFTAVTLRKVAHMRLTQYAYDFEGTAPNTDE